LRLLQELVGHHTLNDEEKENMETLEGLDYDVVETRCGREHAAQQAAPELSKWALTFGVSTAMRVRGQARCGTVG